MPDQRRLVSAEVDEAVVAGHVSSETDWRTVVRHHPGVLEHKGAELERYLELGERPLADDKDAAMDAGDAKHTQAAEEEAEA